MRGILLRRNDPDHHARERIEFNLTSDLQFASPERATIDGQCVIDEQE
jgi:hypothetical protein